MSSKWINDKTLDIIQVILFVIVLGIYAASIKLDFLEDIRNIFLLIGAILTAGIILLRFTMVDRLAKKSK